MDKEKRNFTYVYTKEKFDEYRKLTPRHKLEWLEKMSRFTYYFTNPRAEKRKV